MQTKRPGLLATLVTVVVLAAFSFPALAADTQASGEKVAVVNGEAITRADFDAEITRVEQKLLSMGRSLGQPEVAQLRKEVLENLIDRELLYQESQSEGIKVDQAAVDEHLQTLKKRFPSEAEFKNALNRAHLTEKALGFQIGKGMAIKELIDRQFVNKTKVSDQEAKAYYDSHQDSFKVPEQIQASHILVRVDPKADKHQKAEARKKIEMIQQRLKKGEDFAALAKEFSEGPSSAKGGALGYFRRGQMVESFEKAAFALKPGEVSDIVETEFGYHLIKVTDRKPEKIIAFAEVKDRLEEYLKQEKIKEGVDQYLEKLKAKAKIERLLKEKS